MNKIQEIKCEIPDGHGRIETGPVRFNDDWPGTFIRGDNSAYYAYTLRMMLNRLNKEGTNIISGTERSVIEGLISDLKACIQGPAKDEL